MGEGEGKPSCTPFHMSWRDYGYMLLQMGELVLPKYPTGNYFSSLKEAKEIESRALNTKSFNNLCFVFNRRVLRKNSYWPSFFYIHLSTIRTKQKLSWLHLTYRIINFQFGYKQRNKTQHYFSENNCCYKTI